jgi:L-ascorbate metabolism protein UlaG (beta-lactamase superfamily)
VLATFVQPRDASGRFTNLDGRKPHGLWATAGWSLWNLLVGRHLTPARALVPTVPPDLALLEKPPAPGAPARITWLGHATFLLQLDGVSLLVDPVLMPSIHGGLRPKLARNVPSVIAADRLPPIDAVLVTHCHDDHLELPTIEHVQGRVLAGLGVERYLRGRGEATTELGWWSSTQVGGVRVTFVPAQHWSRRGLFDLNRTLWGGFVVEGSRATIYHSGDTAWFGGFREIGARFPALDAALLPIGAYRPRWFMERHHLDPEQALRAFQDLGARTFVAMHWGTFKLAEEALDAPPRRLEEERIRRQLSTDEVRVMAVGETLAIGREGTLPGAVDERQASSLASSLQVS